MPDPEPNQPRGVLITRPEPGASDTARRLRAFGWEPVLAPMLQLVGRPALLPDAAGIQAVLVTSSAAVPALPPTLHHLPMLAVGDATANAARRAGFADVTSAGADAAALARLTAQQCRPDGKPLLLATAVGQGAPLVEALRARGFRVHRRAVYDARPVDEMPDPARAALRGGNLCAALFFSPATGRAFVRAIQGEASHRLCATIDAMVISAATETAVSLLPWRRIRVASRPTQDELLALLS